MYLFSVGLHWYENFSGLSFAVKIVLWLQISVDPATAIREHYQALLQMGRTQDIHQLLVEMGVTITQQQQQQPSYPAGHVHFPGEGNLN